MPIPALVKQLGSTGDKAASTTTLSHTFTGATAAGNLIVARIIFDNAATASKPVVSSIGRMAGETATWTLLGAARSTSTSAGAFASGEMWCIKTTVNWTAAAYVITFDTAITQKAASFIEFSGTLATQRSTAGTNYSTTTTAASAATTGTAPQVNDLAIGLIFGSNAAAAQAGDNDTSGGAWSAVVGFGTTGGNVATNNFGIGQYKVLTAATAQTLNNSAAMTAGNGAIVAILQSIPDPAFTQAAYQFFDDAGTESGATSLAAVNTPIIGQTTNGDGYGVLRIRLQNTTANAGQPGDDFTLQYDWNSSGAWVDATSAGMVVGYNNPNLTDGAASTNRLGAGTGSFMAGKVSETGVVTDLGVSASNYTELVYSLKIVASLVQDGNTLPFRVVYNGSPTLMTYTQTPLITIKGPVPVVGSAGGVATTSGALTVGAATFTQASYQIFASGTESASTANAAQDTPWPWTPTSQNLTNFQVRVRLQNTSTDTGGSATDDFQLQYEKNASGTWTNVDPSGTPYSTTSGLTNNAATTNRLGTGTGTFTPGKQATGTTGVVDCAVPANSYTELVYGLGIDNGLFNVVVHGDTFRFRVTRNGLTNGFTYSATPTVSFNRATVSQSNYRFYVANATESGAAALAAQNTAYTADLTAGNVNLALRMMLQVTNAVAMNGIDDIALQYELNASGTWNTAGISPFFANGPSSSAYGTTTSGGRGQSFIGNGGTLTKVSVRPFKQGVQGSSSGTLQARLYAHTGTFGGASGVGTGAILASSTNTVDLATVTASSSITAPWVDFLFDNTFTLVNGTPYVILVWFERTTGDASNYPGSAISFALPGHPGSSPILNSTGTWTGATNSDMAFRLTSSVEDTVPVTEYDSPSLTHQAVTTNRLTGGTGTFSTGYVYETGLGSGRDIPASAFTEHLFSITLTAVKLSNADTIRFRVMREGIAGALGDITYTVTPTINVVKGAAALAGSTAGASTTTAALTVTAPAGGLGPNSTPNAVGWWDGSDTASITTSGGEITRWADKSGLNRYLDRYTVGYGPSHTAGVLNGLAVVQFSAGDFVLNSAGNMITGTTCSLFVVCRVLTTSDYGRIASLRTSTGNGFDWDNDQGFGLAQDPNVPSLPSVTRNYSSFSGPCLENPGVIFNTWMVISVVFNGTSGVLYVNGTSVDTVTGSWAGGGVFDIDTIALGSDSLNAGTIVMDVAEVVAYSDAKVGAARTGIESYLTTKWLPPAGPIPTTGLVGWYDADDAASFTYSSGSDVSQWNDRSGNGKHLPVASAGREPSRTGSQMGKPTVVFTGTDKLTTDQILITTYAFTIIATFKKTGANNSYEAFPLTQTANNQASPLDIYNGTVYVGGSSTSLTVPVTGATTWQTWTLVGSAPYATADLGGVLSFRQIIDGVQQGSEYTASAWGWTNTGYVGLGSRNDNATQFTGEVAEIVVYNRVLSDPERTQVEDYLEAKWLVAPVGGPVALAGSSAGTSTDTATLVRNLGLAGAAAGASTDTSALARATPLAATVAGAGTTTSALALTTPLAATVAGTATDISALAVTRTLQATVAGTATVAATTMVSVLGLAATGVAGTNTDTATLSVTTGPLALASATAGASTVTGTLVASRGLQASVPGASTSTAALALALPLAAASGLGTSTAAGTTFAVARALVATVPGTSTDTAALALARPLQASVASVSTATGVLVANTTLAATATGLATVVADLTGTAAPGGPIALAGSAGGVSTADGTLYKSLTLTTSVSGSGSDSGVLAVARALQASSAGASTDTAALAGTKPLGASSAGVSTDTGAVVLGKPLASATAGLSAPSGALQMAWGLQASSAGGTTTFANLSTTGFGGFVAGTTTVTGSLAVTHTLSASSAGAGTSTAALQRAMLLSALAAGTSTVTIVLHKLVGLTGAAQGLGTIDASARVALTLVGTAVSATVVPATVLKVDATSQARSTGAATAQATLVILTSSPVKVWDGTKYAIAFLKVWDGVAWVDAATAVYSGSAFVPNS